MDPSSRRDAPAPHALLEQHIWPARHTYAQVGTDDAEYFDAPPYADTLYDASYEYPSYEQDLAVPMHMRPSVASLGTSKPSSEPGASSLHLEPTHPLDASASTHRDSEQWVERQQPPRHGHTRQVQLTSGNWIVDYPVPTPVANAVTPDFRAQGGRKEFTHLRYSAVTCDPDEFVSENGWGLRTTHEYGRATELLIALTYYNEDRCLLTRTLYSVMQNIRHLCKRWTKRYTHMMEEGAAAWQRIVVTLVFDGIDPCDKEVLDVLATMGVYQDGIMKRNVNGSDTVAHLFEYTTQVCIDATPQLVQPTPGSDANLVPVQTIFCFKQHNSKKINSHRWVFHALGRMLNPKIVVLVDVGTKPGHLALYRLWQAFDDNPHLGGACGEIHAMIQHGLKLVNPLVAAQHFEYKISNILDKPLESLFGYVSVLPGAFSAYRYEAVLGRPLDQYFHGDHTLSQRYGAKGVDGMNIFRKNMFLAEDRILCFEVVAKRGECWTLSYIKPSRAETDVPEHVAELITQRRRWLNGSFAASLYSLFHFYRFYRSGHNAFRILLFHIQALYNVIQLVYTWFALGNLWLTFAIIIQYLPGILLRDFSDPWLIAFHYINLVFMWMYVFTLALQFVLALGNRPKSETPTYVLSLGVFGFLGMYTLAISLWMTIHSLSHLVSENKSTVDIVLSNTTAVLIASLAAMYGIYLLASLLYLDPWHMLTSAPQYFFMAPSFVNVINVYAFCNLHDVSWGTKGSDKVDALPSVTTQAEHGDTVEEVAPSQTDIDLHFKDVVDRAVAPFARAHTRTQSTLDDSYKTFRTRLVALWLLSNAVLVAVIMNLYAYTPHKKLDDEVSQGRHNQQIYFKVILWSTFGLAFVRFVGSVLFWLIQGAWRWSRH